MKHLSFAFLLFFIFSACRSDAQKANLVWHTDLMEAQKISKDTHKPIFAFFTGSDWCVWCHKLENEVFSKKAFIDWSQKVVLLEVDFPRGKQLPPELVQQNNNLQQAFQVRGYPTVWLFFMDKDPKSDKLLISPLGSTGYPQGAEAGREEVKFLADANALLAKMNSK